MNFLRTIARGTTRSAMSRVFGQLGVFLCRLYPRFDRPLFCLVFSLLCAANICEGRVYSYVPASWLSVKTTRNMIFEAKPGLSLISPYIDVINESVNVEFPDSLSNRGELRIWNGYVKGLNVATRGDH